MEELTEVITAASCHPEQVLFVAVLLQWDLHDAQCNVFLWSNSRGRSGGMFALKMYSLTFNAASNLPIRVTEPCVTLTQKVLLDITDETCLTSEAVFEEEDDPSRRSFFSEIISSIGAFALSHFTTNK